MCTTKRIFKGVIIFSSLALTLTSCLKDDTEELIAEHDRALQAMKAVYGITEADLIGDGVYLHIIDSLSTPGIHPADQNVIIANLAGFDSDGTIFDVTDSATAKQNNVYRPDLVYGPIRVNINNTFPGFYNAIQKVPEGANAVMLIPYDMAFGGYEPIAYKVELFKVVTDFDAFVHQEFEAYKDSLGIDDANNLDDIGADSAYESRDTAGYAVPDLQIGDSAKILLHAYYVETDPSFVQGFPGRCFFPINESGDIITFDVGTTSFPITGIINSLVMTMNVGDRREIITPAAYAYGDDGFVHPYTGIYIVPPAMDIHYTIELIDYVKNSK